MLVILLTASGLLLAQNSVITISGQLKDSKSGDKITHATITVPGSNIGTVSNSEGEFTLKIPASQNAQFFEVSHLSYTTSKIMISEAAGKDKTYLMDLQPIQLRELAVVPADARSVVNMAMQRIRENYSEVPNMMTGFYRESIRQRRDYLSISEAVVDIRKAPYISYQDDQVKIFKGRKSTNVKKADTLMVQLQGGPNVAMLLDIVKNTDLSIALDSLDNYTFEFGSVVTIDNELNWVINFKPNVVKDAPLYNGKLYISQEKMAITRAEFSLDLEDEDKATSLFVRKKPMGLRFSPTSTSYLVTYKEQNGKYYLSYVRVDLKFRCDWKRRLFRNHYTVMSELAITDRREDNIVKFANQEIFRTNMVFEEKVQAFADPDFWGDNNIIEPENSIENAIKKLSKGVKN
jgi:hypothetical protein